MCVVGQIDWRHQERCGRSIADGTEIDDNKRLIDGYSIQGICIFDASFKYNYGLSGDEVYEKVVVRIIVLTLV